MSAQAPNFFVHPLITSPVISTPQSQLQATAGQITTTTTQHQQQQQQPPLPQSVVLEMPADDIP